VRSAGVTSQARLLQFGALTRRCARAASDDGAVTLNQREQCEPEIGYTASLLTRADRVVTAALDVALRDVGISPSQYGVLRKLVRLGRASSSELARSLSVTRQAMTGRVSAVEKMGYLRRKSLKSGRVIEVSLTPAGRRAFDRATARVASVDTELESLLTDSGVDRLQSVLRACVEGFEFAASRRDMRE